MQIVHVQSLPTQLILSGFVYIITFMNHYMASKIILDIYGEKVSATRKVAFAIVAGVLLHTVVFQGIRYMQAAFSLPMLVTTLFSEPNPIFALFYYFIACKIFKLSPIRSIRLMTHAYLYIFSCSTLIDIIGCVLAKAMGGHLALYELLCLLLDVILVFLVTHIFLFLIHKTNYRIDLRDAMFVKSIPLEALRSFIWIGAAYAISLTHVLFDAGETFGGHFLVAFSTISIFTLGLMWDINRVARTRLQNKTAYVGALSKSMDDFRGFKHDFKNILQTYSGYIEINDMEKLRQYHETMTNKLLVTESQLELAKRMEDCPAIISLLMEKLEYAGRNGVDFRLQIGGKLSMADDRLLATSRCIASLLDNAVEAAAESQRKMMLFSFTEKKNGNQLFVITNSTQGDVDIAKCCRLGFTTKESHMGVGLTTVRNIIDEDPLATLNMTYYQNEFSVYIEIFQADKSKDAAQSHRSV